MHPALVSGPVMLCALLEGGHFTNPRRALGFLAADGQPVPPQPIAAFQVSAQKIKHRKKELRQALNQKSSVVGVSNSGRAINDQSRSRSCFLKLSTAGVP